MYEDKKLFYNIVITDIFQKDLKKNPISNPEPMRKDKL